MSAERKAAGQAHARVLARHRHRTRKVAGKTVPRRLTQDQYAAYRSWFDASQQLRALLAELEALSLEIIEAELRPGHRDSKPRTDLPRKTPAT